MHWYTIPTEQTDDVIITTTIILQEINYQKPHLIFDAHRPQAITYQLSNIIMHSGYSTQLRCTYVSEYACMY